MLVVGLPTAFAANLALIAAGYKPLWAAALIYAVLTYTSSTPLHEAAHGNSPGAHERSAPA